MLLSDLFRFYGTDKLGHGYAAIYELLLQHRRHAIKQVLEIGIGTITPDANSSMYWQGGDYTPGASLRAWRDYFPNAHIYGIDTQPDCMCDTDPRITTLLANSTNIQQVNQHLAGQQFDLIIDDGSHIAIDQVRTLTNCWPYLAPGGVYVIEDILSDYLLRNPVLRRIVAPCEPITMARDVWVIVIAKDLEHA